MSTAHERLSRAPEALTTIAILDAGLERALRLRRGARDREALAVLSGLAQAIAAHVPSDRSGRVVTALRAALLAATDTRRGATAALLSACDVLDDALREVLAAERRAARIGGRAA